MILRLFHRTYGVHSLIDTVEIPYTFGKYVKGNKFDGYKIMEDLLLQHIPKDFLRQPPNLTLLSVQDISRTGSEGQRGLTKFRNWSKYYSCYCLELSRPEKKLKKKFDF